MRKFLRYIEKDVQSWYGTVVIMGCDFVTMEFNRTASLKNPRIANTVVYIIACYIIYYIILVYGSHKKKIYSQTQYSC